MRKRMVELSIQIFKELLACMIAGAGIFGLILILVLVFHFGTLKFFGED
jgi:hypothetical protein